MSSFTLSELWRITWKTNKQIQQITGVRSLAQEILELTCLLGRVSHSLAVTFYLSPQDVLLHCLFQGPLLPVHVPTAAEGTAPVCTWSLLNVGSSCLLELVALHKNVADVQHQESMPSFRTMRTFFLPVLFISSRQDVEQFPSSVARSVGLGFCGFYNDT